ncbi:MAG TPA: TMEM165/GDT1 family protein [Bacillota bacterium]|nr:TMEM165/GDT1 family protein [Bacillota bacterium]
MRLITEGADAMDSQLFTFLFSVGAVTLAEMGDKTQLLAMAFATRYKASKVLWGVFIATVFNHGLAVAVGNLLTKFQSAEVWIQGIAALSFVFFGLWTIRGDRLEGEENRTSKYGAVMTVTIAFFLAELGDKTQLATIALATRFPVAPVAILMGTTTGMLIADAIGICIGVVACKRIPERTIKLVSAGAFILFGLIGIYQVATEKLQLGLLTVAGIITVVAALTAWTAYCIVKKEQLEAVAMPGFCATRESQEKVDLN